MMSSMLPPEDWHSRAAAASPQCCGARERRHVLQNRL
jgi:hypothetical protein